MVEFQTITTQGGMLKVFCENYRACAAINRMYPHYIGSGRALYVFKEGEEAIFYVPTVARDKILRILKKHNCLY